MWPSPGSPFWPDITLSVYIPRLRVPSRQPISLSKPCGGGALSLFHGSLSLFLSRSTGPVAGALSLLPCGSLAEHGGHREPLSLLPHDFLSLLWNTQGRWWVVPAAAARGGAKSYGGPRGEASPRSAGVQESQIRRRRARGRLSSLARRRQRGRRAGSSGGPHGEAFPCAAARWGAGSDGRAHGRGLSRLRRRRTGSQIWRW